MLMLSFMGVKMSWLKMRQYRKPARGVDTCQA
jgi:hypothetical protein